MEEKHRTGTGQGSKPPCPLGVSLAPNLHMLTSHESPTWKFPTPSLFEFLWRSHYIGMLG